MDDPNHTLKPDVPNDRILVLSWNIATEPKLYLELAPNPYTPQAQQMIATRFPDVSIVDVIRAVVLAEPERKYDRIFKQLTPELQVVELARQKAQTNEITSRLNEYYRQHTSEFRELAKDLLYDLLFKYAFQTSDQRVAEQKYSQKQRKAVKLLILDLVESQLIQNSVPKKNFVLPSSLKAFSRVSLAVLSATSFLYLTFPFFEKYIVLGQKPKTGDQVLAINTQETDFPVHLKIPSINVDADIQYLGQTKEGVMDVPDNALDVGWYKLSPSPGKKGSAVISGHFDGGDGGAGVFDNLDKLKPGDQIYVLNDLGVTNAFVVKKKLVYSPGLVEEVFKADDNGSHLNLITCDGAWDGAKKSYTKRLVVFTDII